ncbi:unnamed protein product [Paramecium primaurelia]|uniref:Ankyrin repeat protein n=1 Tax=Paramecium primaurelia TaxID=5886 RepID=A0A8S1KV35_PARPR|nr:unnamed protein product [Paramecium primaurelia]
MIKRNLKWRINSQRENSTGKPKSISIESSPRQPIYLIRREVKPKNSQLKSPLSTYTKYVFRSNQISPVSSPNTSKIIKLEEQLINFNNNNCNQERKHSISTLSTENRSFKHKISANNRHLQTESIKLITQQFTEQNVDIIIDNEIKQQQIDIECTNIDMQHKKISSNYLFNDKKKKQLRQRMQLFQSKEQKRSSQLTDQVMKLIRTIKQPSYRYEANQRSSRIWLENACFEPVKLQENYTYSQSQFKFYFSQYFDKHLKFYRILEINNELLQLMNNHQQITKDIQEQRKAVFLDKIYSNTHIQLYKTESLFRFQNEIQTYGMIDFLNENSQLSISVDHNTSELNDKNNKEQLQLDEDEDSELFKQAKTHSLSNLIPIQPEQNTSLNNYQFQLTSIISELDKNSKNILLSVDYTNIDQQIYKDNINQIVPTFQEEFSNPIFYKVYTQHYNKNYKDILNGNFCNLNPIDDLEYEAPDLYVIEKGNLQKEDGIDKKKMLNSLRQKKNWFSGVLQKQSQPIDTNSSHRATIQIFSNKQSSDIGVESPQLPQINILQQSSNEQTISKSIRKSIHGRNALSPTSPGNRDNKFQQVDNQIKNQIDTSQDSVGEIKKITMSKSQQQLPKLMFESNLTQSKILKKEDSNKNFKDFKMVSSIKSDFVYNDSMSDSVNSNIQQINLQNKGANPQKIKLETMLLYDKMMKRNRSKKKIAIIMIEHGLLNQFQEFMDVHRNFNLNGITQDGIPLISLAAANGHEGIIRHMLNFNVNLNQIDKNGNTPLHYAMLHNNYEIADLLLQNGANPYIKNQGR